MERVVGNTRIRLMRGDITAQDVDAIVNAANSHLVGGGGVDGAIHRAAGPTLAEACKAVVAERGALPTGEAVATPAGQLRARHVIHAVGPVWRGGSRGEPELLARTYQRCLELARELGLKRVAFPSISTGAFGYPAALAAPVAMATVRDAAAASGLEEIRFVLFKPEDYQIYQAAMTVVMPRTGDGMPPSPPP
ncbi:MAG: O-acetyl-ADP-ribose deacetylase [Myxococcota bacterium]